MEENKTEKLSYEQLEQLTKQLYQQLMEINMNNTFKRLDYLFKVVNVRDVFSEEFITKCSNEIETLLTLDESNNKEA